MLVKNSTGSIHHDFRRLPLDGRRVYSSPDFGPRYDVPDRATLLWDRSGRILLFEVARHRLFGFDSTTGRPLADAELLAAKPPEEPALGKYRFEGEWPGVGR